MSKVPYLAAHLDKKAGKEECFNIVRRMADGATPTESELAAMYSYFLPPKPRKISDPFEWVAQVCDAKANYAFCKFIESSNGCLAAANTRSAHIVMSDLGLKPGFYDPGRGYAGDDVAIMPDYLTAMTNACVDGEYPDFNIDTLEIVDTPSGLAYVLPWSGTGVPKDYLDLIFRTVCDPQVFRDNDGAFCVMGTIRDISVCAVTMPGKINRI